MSTSKGLIHSDQCKWWHEKRFFWSNYANKTHVLRGCGGAREKKRDQPPGVQEELHSREESQASRSAQNGFNECF